MRNRRGRTGRSTCRATDDLRSRARIEDVGRPLEDLELHLDGIEILAGERQGTLCLGEPSLHNGEIAVRDRAPLPLYLFLPSLQIADLLFERPLTPSQFGGAFLPVVAITCERGGTARYLVVSACWNEPDRGERSDDDSLQGKRRVYYARWTTPRDGSRSWLES